MSLKNKTERYYLFTTRSFATRCVWAICLLSAFISGCADFTTVGTRALFAGSSTKSTMLSERVKSFGQARFWQDETAMSAMMNSNARLNSDLLFSSNDKTEKLVEITSKKQDIFEDSSKALVTLNVKYYKIPIYQVEERKEELLWVFDRFGGGWYLDSWNKGPIVKNDN